MATKTIKMVFQFRRAHTSEWLEHKDIVPAAGEPCFDLDLNILKIGDGIKTYEELEPINGAKLSADGKSIILTDGVFKLMGFDAAEIGAQPRKGANGEIEWFVPSTEAVDNLQKDVVSLQKSVLDLTTKTDELQTGVEGLKLDVVNLRSDNTSLLGKIEGLETRFDDTDSAIDQRIDAKINEFANHLSDDGTVNTLKELVTYVANHGGEVETLVNDITTLQQLVGTDPVHDQIVTAIANSGHMTKDEAEDTLLSKIDAAETYVSKKDVKEVFEKIKYEVINTPVGTLVDYRDKEIRVMVPAGAEFNKQNVGTGGDANTYYCTFKTYAPDNAVGYIEHLGSQIDSEILRDLKVDAYGRKYQPTWLGLAKYNDASGWTYYGKTSTVNKYVGWDYQIDWYDADGVVIASDKVRINLSNETCHHNVEPFYMSNVVKEVAVNGTLLEMVDGRVNITIEDTLCVKSSDEIAVAEDGTLSIKEISFDKITQAEGTVLVMDGGSAV